VGSAPMVLATLRSVGRLEQEVEGGGPGGGGDSHLLNGVQWGKAGGGPARLCHTED
jgi:hypothetical protein